MNKKYKLVINGILFKKEQGNVIAYFSFDDGTLHNNELIIDECFPFTQKKIENYILEQNTFHSKEELIKNTVFFWDEEIIDSLNLLNKVLTK